MNFRRPAKTALGAKIFPFKLFAVCFRHSLRRSRLFLHLFRHRLIHRLLPRALLIVELFADGEADAAQRRFGRNEQIHSLFGLLGGIGDAVDRAEAVNQNAADGNFLHQRIHNNLGAERIRIAVAVNPPVIVHIVLRRLAEKLVEGRITSENVTVADRMEYILSVPVWKQS